MNDIFFGGWTRARRKELDSNSKYKKQNSSYYTKIDSITQHQYSPKYTIPIYHTAKTTCSYPCYDNIHNNLCA